MAEYIRGNWKTNEVTIDGKRLPLQESLMFVNISPAGFSWGYGGAGPSQLAFAILARYTSHELAGAYYSDFKNDVIAKLPKSDFELPVDEVRRWLDSRTDEQRINANRRAKNLSYGISLMPNDLDGLYHYDAHWNERGALVFLDVPIVVDAERSDERIIITADAELRTYLGRLKGTGARLPMPKRRKGLRDFISFPVNPRNLRPLRPEESYSEDPHAEYVCMDKEDEV
ncbi:MAG: hypothetical protein HYW24_02320 [Candidatus Aenigmarchaeota archaeon]|nr:hypothetical protein [Candidatus Aenigmarchaeota archaeon]